MKFIVALIISVIGFSAHAQDMVCKNIKTDAFEETVTLKISNDIYEVSHYGHSRNQFKATYKLVDSQGTRYGYKSTLKKIHDDSTWKDMPSTLVLKDYMTANFNFVLSGLSNSSHDAAFFELKDCTY